jgi:hypothetical protein
MEKGKARIRTADSERLILVALHPASWENPPSSDPSIGDRMLNMAPQTFGMAK